MSNENENIDIDELESHYDFDYSQAKPNRFATDLMKQEIIDDLEKTLEIGSRKFHNDDTLASFEQASIEFEKLVKSGLVQKRGYNLMTIDRKHLHQSSMISNFNRLASS